MQVVQTGGANSAAEAALAHYVDEREELAGVIGLVKGEQRSVSQACLSKDIFQAGEVGARDGI